MIKQELVDEEKWISQERFNHVLAVYQVLPGPEAHELCVYFGMLARGRWGGFLAGLGFMLPGFVLLLGLSVAYVHAGAWSVEVRSMFVGMQAAVIALIAKGLYRIGKGALRGRALTVLAVASGAASLLGVHFAVSLAAAGSLAWAIRRRQPLHATALATAWVALAVLWALRFGPAGSLQSASVAGPPPDLTHLLLAGAKTGLLTFGGAYTAIPLLGADAVGPQGWMTSGQFLDGLALSGILPAPLIIFVTFVGYMGARLAGALVITAATFAPAFGFTLVAHRPLERLIESSQTRTVLDGVTAGVVGLIGATLIGLVPATIVSPATGVIALGALAILWFVKTRLTVLWVMGLAAGAGVLFC